jgi:hypothetical protein
VAGDGTYFAPETMTPHSGPVFRPFPGDTARAEVRGTLLDGVWHGDFAVYHPSGRLRYAGSFSRGEKCGAWTENLADREPGNVYDELLSETETLGLYPVCPPDR